MKLRRNSGIALMTATFLLVIILVVSILITAKTAVGQNISETLTVEEFTDHLDRRIPALMDSYNVPGLAIALVHAGEIAWLKAYGYADLETCRLMTTDTYCRVESITKSVTAWGVLKLAEQGKIDLDAPAMQYVHDWQFPVSSYPTTNITVRQLLSMTAGLPLGTVGVIYSPEEAMPSLEEKLSAEAIPFQEPGSSFYYSNVSFNLLELIIEQVTERDFAEYMETEILSSLGMTRSKFTWSSDFDPAVPVGYNLKGEPVPVYVYPEKASGGMFASVEDMAAFTVAGVTGAFAPEQGVLKQETIKELYLPQVKISGFYSLVFDAYGMGHFIEHLPDGNFTVSHGGQGSGIMTHFQSLPETGDGIVILTNSQRSWPLFAYLLKDWGGWLGYPSMGLSVIILGQTMLNLVIVLVLLLCAGQLWRLVKGLLSGRRHFAPFGSHNLVLRAMQFSLGVVLTALLLWGLNQSYLFITSVFPKEAGLLALVMVVSATTLFITALMPERQN